MANTPISFNANAVIQAAFLDLGVFAPGESIPAPDGQLTLARLNNCVNALQLSPLTFPFVTREVFDVVSGTSTYSIGPGGDFDTVRPAGLTGAGLLMPSQAATTGPIEIPRGLMTDDAYQTLQTKDLQNAMWTAVYYNPTYSGGLGSVFLWPTPNSTTYQLVLYRSDVLQGFANLTTAYDFPQGLFEVLQYQLGKRLAPAYGATGWTPMLEEMARDTLFLFKRNNFKLADLTLDPAMTKDRRGGYNIQTGTGGGA